ncbi:leucine-rich PPR motif-containing protein, mitochondrial [Cylas formicarius]|uniref:leucine-rich PPR motif-containing protein, mitochondrial n=1 Tax=Cylas formicarius TaxID=197179 RepID=UPI002958BA57|nr:leucine-rich PPR motif-containing protein, mitochondrial [Cylas formicarius]
MASILRSSKFVRYIAGFARNVVVSTPREFDGSLVNTANPQCLCGALSRSLTSQTSAHHDQSLELRLKTLDQDVRKSGRISRRDIEDILEEIRNTRSATSSQSLLVIRCCGSLVPEELPEVRTQLVQEIWTTLKKLNVPMDVSHYNALLRVYLENEHPFSPTDFLSDMESKGIEPNRVTYQRLIARYCQNGDIEGATKILEFMREKQMPVNENVFNALIIGHSETGDMDSAQGILSVMSQAGLEASADTYTTLLCGYAKKGDIDKILKIADECETKEIYLLDKDYLDIIYSLATNGHSQHVPLIIRKLRKSVGYNQDAINMILRLINKNQEPAAYEILRSMSRGTRSDGTLMPVGSFFIRQLVKSGKPVGLIQEYCDRLSSEGFYDRGFFLATEVAMEMGKEEVAYELFNKLQEKGIEIRQHYFWPLIVSKGKEKSEQGIIKILQKMGDFGLTPNNETIRDYVLPYLHGNSSHILEVLRDTSVSIATITSSLVITLLQKNNIAEAAALASSVNAYYIPEQVRQPLTRSFYETMDINSYITILRSVYENLDRKRNTKSDDAEEIDRSEILGSFVLALAFHPKFLNVLVPVLSRLVEQGLSISTTSAQKIEEKLGEKMTEEISVLLGKLTSGELTPIPFEKKKPIYTPADQMNIQQLEILIKNLESKGQDTKGLKRKLFTLYYRAKDLEKMEYLLEDLKKQDFVINSGIYAQMLDIYAYKGMLEQALEQYEKLKQMAVDQFVLDEGKVINLAHLLARNGRFDDAIKLLEETSVDTKLGSNYNYFGQVWRFLNYLAEEGRVDELNQLFDVLLRKELIEVNNGCLGPLIKVHLVRKELDKALEKFEWAVTKFRCTPWKNELACQLIQVEDAENLQKLTDLSTVVHGEINSLYDLVFSFVECGRIRQARKILETPGMQNRPQRINNACERYQSEGMIKPLEDLRDATRDLNHIDRSDIYYQLLLSYIKQDDPEKCLGLWTQMQEEDIPPSEDFLLKLSNFLNEKNLDVPFVVPNKTSAAGEPAHLKSTFKQKLNANDIDGCLRLIKNSIESFSLSDLSVLIEKLVQSDRLKEASNLTLNVLGRGQVPATKVLKFLANRLALAGNTAALEALGKKINHNMEKALSFHNKLCQAYLVAGKGDQFLHRLEAEIDNVAEENLEYVGEKFPRGGACGILERHPELTGKYEEIAIKYAKKNLLGPLNILWNHYFIGKEADKANQIWNEYLVKAPKIMFQRIVKHAREHKDDDLIQKLINHLKIGQVTEGAMGNAYSCYLDILVAKGDAQEVKKVFEKALKEVKIESLNRTAVLRVKALYESLGEVFNYPIPSKSAKKVEEESL